MTDVSVLAVLGLRSGTLGTSGSLAIAAPLSEGNPSIAAHTDASRIGWYFDRTGAAEKIGLVVMGAEVFSAGAAGVFAGVNQVWDAGNLVNPEVQANKGMANGYASLDGTGKVPAAQLPAGFGGGLTYQGAWNANTNAPVLASGVGTAGDYYVVSVAGTTNLDGISDWQEGDVAAFNGTTWDKFDNTDSFAVKASLTDATPGFLDAKVDGTTIAVVADQLSVVLGGITIPSTQATLDTTGFNNILSGADTNVQLAMDTLDDHTHALGQLSDVFRGTAISTPDSTPTVIDTTTDATVQWLLRMDNGSGVTVALTILTSADGANNTKTTLLPGTDAFPHTVTVDRTGGSTTLSITASGVGYDASYIRYSIP